MILSFIDIEHGTTFNGEQPYDFWFDEGQSVNLIYTKKISFLSDSETEDVCVEDNTPFFLIDQEKLKTEQQMVISNESYFDLDKVKSNTITSTGVSYNGKYIHLIYMCCKSENAGQYKATYTVGNNIYNIGADFYNQDETLTGNLENLGIEIPSTVQKAIYESNVHEEATDNILMNRKWKELLLEYWNIVALKGSYKSLISSLKWFEYGDLINILEYWKRTDTGRKILLSNDIEQILSDLFRDQLSVLSKTTYIGLYLALEKPSQTEREDDNYPFFNSYYTEESVEGDILMRNENNPVLEKVATIWSAQDLSLKMTLVGNFFATYFMPIHLDLIHSTIENIVFTNAIKVMAGGCQDREDWFFNGGTFRCNSVTKDSNWYMQPVDCEVGPLTILGLKDIVDVDKYPTLLGYNLVKGDTLGNNNVPVEEELDIQDIIFAATNRYEAYGAPIRFDVEIHNNVHKNDFIKAAQIHWRRNGTELFDYRDSGIYIEQEDGIYKFSFNILIEKEGRYDISIIFESAKGVWYSRKFNINVIDNTDNRIKIYRIRRGDLRQWNTSKVNQDDDGIWFENTRNTDIVSDVNEFMFQSIDDYMEMNYAQFIHSANINFSKSVGMNHVLIFPSSMIDGLQYADGSKSLINNYSLTQLKNTFPNYWWFKKNTEIWLDWPNKVYGKQDVFIGIRKYFSVDSTLRTVFEKQYTYNENRYEVKIVQSGILLNITVNNKTTAQCYSNYLVPLTNEIEVDLCGIHTLHIDLNLDCTINASNQDSDLGCPGKKVQVIGYCPRLVDEDRFIPLFHILEPITESNYELGPGESAIAVPYFSRTQQDVFDELTISFKHCGTGEIVNTKPGILELDTSVGNTSAKIGIRVKGNINSAQMVFANYRRCKLKRGYYDAAVRYKYNGDWHTESQEGAFRII